MNITRPSDRERKMGGGGGTGVLKLLNVSVRTTIATEMADNSHQEQLCRRISVCTVQKSVNTPNTTAVQTKIILLHAFGIDISNDTPDIHICNSKMIKIVKLRIYSHIKSKVEVYT